jgi:Ca-activated chloride channel family protein
VIVFGKWRGEARGRVVIEGQSASGPYREEVEIDGRTPQNAAALRSLWARHRIAALSDQESLEGGDAFAKRNEGEDRNAWLYSYNPLTVELI